MRSSVLFIGLHHVGIAAADESHQGVGRELHLVADLAGAHQNGGVVLGGGVDDGFEPLLHADGGTAPPDVAGEGGEFLDVDHLDGLLPHGLGRLFEVQLGEDGHHKDVVGLGGPPGHQGLVDLTGVPAQDGGHRGPVHRLPFVVGVAVGGIGDLFLIQNAHDVGLFFCHRNAPLLLKG